MKYLLTVLLCTIGLITVQGQTSSQQQLTNKWYSFSLDPILVVEYHFQNNIFTTKKLNWDLKPSPETDTATVLKVVTKKNAQYYLLKSKANPGKVLVKVFYIAQPGVSFVEPDISEPHSIYNNVEAALKFVTADTIKRPGLVFYSRKELERMQSLTDAATITKVDLKKYLLNVISSREQFEQYAKRHTDDFGIMASFSYLSNQARVSLAQIGYNPLIGDKELDVLNDKFKDDAEIKQLVDKAFKFE
jgi:hypothetical protein